MRTKPESHNARVQSAKPMRAHETAGVHVPFKGDSSSRASRSLRWSLALTAAAALLAASGSIAQAPAPAQPASAADAAASAPPAAAPARETAQARPVRNSDRRKAAKLYLEASKLFEKEEFEEAMQLYDSAAALDPGNADYALAVSVARSHLVTALIQAAAKDRLRGDAAAARAALARALELDPKNPQVDQHLNELGDDALLGQTRPLYEQGAETAGAGVVLEPASGVRSFHLRSNDRQIIEQVFKTYGIEASVDESVPTPFTRLDLDNVELRDGGADRATGDELVLCSAGRAPRAGGQGQQGKPRCSLRARIWRRFICRG